LREEMHFEIDKTNPTSAIRKSPTDGHSLKSASPYEKTNSPAPLTDYDINTLILCHVS